MHYIWDCVVSVPSEAQRNSASEEKKYALFPLKYTDICNRRKEATVLRVTMHNTRSDVAARPSAPPPRLRRPVTAGGGVAAARGRGGVGRANGVVVWLHVTRCARGGCRVDPNPTPVSHFSSALGDTPTAILP